MARRRALIFDRILEVDTDAAIVRVRPQRAAAIALAVVIANHAPLSARARALRRPRIPSRTSEAPGSVAAIPRGA